jgi:S-adenosylmethionine hydrolase
MWGVVLATAPFAHITDITHAIQPQAVLEGAFAFAQAWRYFPRASIHIVVVDPGVGSTRRRIALGVADHLFVGPDNGCLSGALSAQIRGRRAPGEAYEAWPVALPPEVVAVRIDNPLVTARHISATFEGRDVFAPAAGYLANGGLLIDLGPRIDSMLAYPEFRAPEAATDPPTSGPGAALERAEVLEGIVLMADRFGNLITDVVAADVPGATELVIAGRTLPIVRTYADASGPSALEGSSGYLELAVPNGSAALELGIRPGGRVTVAKGV